MNHSVIADIHEWHTAGEYRGKGLFYGSNKFYFGFIKKSSCL